MGSLIDSSILIAHERGRLDLPGHLDRRSEEDFLISVVTVSELLHGVHRAQEAALRNRRSAWVEAVLEQFPVLSIDTSTARAHARLSAELAQKGRKIGPSDLWLAASCLAHGFSIITANEREFSRVPGLEWENWLA